MQNIFLVPAMQHGCRAKPLFAPLSVYFPISYHIRYKTSCLDIIWTPLQKIMAKEMPTFNRSDRHANNTVRRILFLPWVHKPLAVKKQLAE